MEQRPVPLSVQYAVQNPAQRQVRHAGQSAVEPVTQIVWFKRDLRVTDHAALASAAANGPVLPLYVFEPEYWARSDVSQRQQHFLIETLIDLDRELMHLGAPLQVFTGSITDVLEQLMLNQSDQPEGGVTLWSHEETGNLWTWQRDKTVAAWLQSRGIPWHECSQHGVIRKLSTRRGWAARWNRFMTRPPIPVPRIVRAVRSEQALQSPAATGLNISSASRLSEGKQSGAIESDVELLLADKWQQIRDVLSARCPSRDETPCANRQTGGRRQALALMQSFFKHRGHSYHRQMSSPETAEKACSRLSAHIALGSISMRELVQCAWHHQAEIKSVPRDKRDERVGTRARAINAYIARLHWHCHFMQKLEDSPHHEVENVHRGYCGLRGDAGGDDRAANHYEAWAQGQTGFPFVDACMRSLHHNGWINFRMRAMLMSFASFQLWLHWRQTGLHLARLFTDYEPGIHWNQVQMQSGTTGINTVRVYNPIKQSMDQDADGVFIRRWVPELKDVPSLHVHQPWLMSENDQRQAQCIIGSDYPAPVVDHMETARVARQRLYAVRQLEGFAAEADRVQERHGSRKSGISNRGAKQRLPKTPKPSPQQSLNFPE